MKNILQNSIKLFISALVLVFIFSEVDIDNLINIFGSVDYKLLLISPILFFIQIFIASLRWQLILNSLEVFLSRLRALKYCWLGFFFNQILPSSIGGDAYKIFLLAKNDKCPISKSISSVLLDRLLGFVGILILITISLPQILQIIQFQFFPLETVHYFVILMVALIFPIGFKLLNQLSEKFKKFFFEIINASRYIFKSRRIYFILIYSILIQLILTLCVWVLAFSIQLSIDLRNLFFIVPLANLLATIPISIAGWGVREGVIVFSLTALGFSIEESTALSLMYGFLIAVVSLPAGFFILFGKHESVKGL